MRHLYTEQSHSGLNESMTAMSRRAGCARCGASLAADNNSGRCASCQRAERDRIVAAPEVPAAFWSHEPLRRALAERHLGRVIRASATIPLGVRRGPGMAPGGTRTVSLSTAVRFP
ncbi:hypothetical protein TPA0908_05030 [Micromonospora sp. AKA38]|nr:hypothetical protein TPA0908_05030 [Micromonospora sp. AKA38]